MKRYCRKTVRRNHIVTTEESQQDANGKQLEKTLAEGMRYLLDNKIATDVCIEVGPPNGETVILHAHNYIYCDKASVSSETAAYLMYAAKKYMFPKLVGDCCTCLLNNLAVNNVISLLDQSLLLDEPLLQRNCLDLIAANAKAVLTGSEILSASRQALEAILGMDTLSVRELMIYETAVDWAKHQLQSAMAGKNPTNLQIRDSLGDLLYKVRFPVMKPTEFAEISSGNDLLTADEKESVYYFFVNKKKHSQLKFPIERRIGKEVWVDRTTERAAGKWFTAPSLDAISFVTDQDILLTGIGLYQGFGQGYDVDVEVLQSVSSVFKKSTRVPIG